MKIITLLFTYNSRITTRYLEQNMTLYECLRRCIGMFNDSWVTCMKELWTVALPQIWCQLHDHTKQYDNDGACHNKRNGGKLHVNISWNGYGNAIIGRYGGCFEEGYVVGLWYRRKLRGTREASNGGKVRVRIIHGLNISHKELTYFLQKSISHRNKVLRACS